MISDCDFCDPVVWLDGKPGDQETRDKLVLAQSWHVPGTSFVTATPVLPRLARRATSVMARRWHALRGTNGQSVPERLVRCSPSVLSGPLTRPNHWRFVEVGRIE